MGRSYKIQSYLRKPPANQNLIFVGMWSSMVVHNKNAISATVLQRRLKMDQYEYEDSSVSENEQNTKNLY